MNKMYYIFGLNIRSEIPLPSPVMVDPPPGLSPDVVIAYGDTPNQLTNPQVREAQFEAAKGEFLLRVKSVANYYVSEGCRIIIQPKPDVGEEEILIFLMGSATGALLHQRNVLVLHAGAIMVNGKSVIFPGRSGIGKSTLTAGFHKRGFPFLADDVCAIAMINGKPAVVPGFPRLKLWADVLKKLNTDQDQLKSVRWTKGFKKYFLPVDFIHATPIPLKSVFVLETTNKDKMEISVLKGMEKINPLIKNTYRMGFLKGLGTKEDHFRQCANIADQTDVYRVIRPQKGFLLNELMDYLQERFD